MNKRRGIGPVQVVHMQSLHILTLTVCEAPCSMAWMLQWKPRREGVAMCPQSGPLSSLQTLHGIYLLPTFPLSLNLCSFSPYLNWQGWGQKTFIVDGEKLKHGVGEQQRRSLFS